MPRLRTPESDAFKKDEQNRQKHMKSAQSAFRQLLSLLDDLVTASVKEFPKKDKDSLKKRGKHFTKLVKTNAAMTEYLDRWIGREDQHPATYSWRQAVIYQARDVLLFGKTQKDALVEVAKQAFKGFEAITMSQAQAPLRRVIPTPLLEWLPKNIVVEVDDDGEIRKVTDRFENEHFTLGKKIEKMKLLIKQYNAIARQVKKDLKSPDERTRLCAIVTAIIMETGIRPGKEGNGIVQTVNGEKVDVETFGATSLGPGHVQFVRKNFAKLEFVGKMGSVNTAAISDAAILKVLQEYVDKALKSGSKYVFVTSQGERFSYNDLQGYFRQHFSGIAPTDFRKLKATETVLAALREEQADLYARIRAFADDAKEDLKDRIVAEVVTTFERAVKRSQQALSHDSAETTVRAYIDPTILLRFLSRGSMDATLKDAVLTSKTTLAFDPQKFVAVAMGKTASRKASLADLLNDLEDDLQDAGIRKLGALHHLVKRYSQCVR